MRKEKNEEKTNTPKLSYAKGLSHAVLKYLEEEETKAFMEKIEKNEEEEEEEEEDEKSIVVAVRRSMDTTFSKSGSERLLRGALGIVRVVALSSVGFSSFLLILLFLTPAQHEQYASLASSRITSI